MSNLLLSQNVRSDKYGKKKPSAGFFESKFVLALDVVHAVYLHRVLNVQLDQAVVLRLTVLPDTDGEAVEEGEI
ncbi:hypothetical protein CGZ75_12340 [Paenibacillus herberti]|uniref:Uncharacterized protein n=2 Tax=Paenibacillus herberti TaxID=1619309 RepID=A0A229P5W9_9BACL|nr:hypothetical protein CGZ75_12340 [Paenibacillus herberti]